MSILKTTYQPPAWLLFIRIAQAVIAVTLVAMTAYVFAVVAYYAGSSFTSTWIPALPFSFFTFAWTVGFLVFTIFFARGLTVAAKPLLIMIILEALTTLWWLVTFALLAERAGQTVNYTTYYKMMTKRGYYDDSTTYDYNSVTVATAPAGIDINAAVACLKASAGIGAIEFLLFVTSLVMTSIEAHRATQASAGAASATNGNVYDSSAQKEAAVSVNQAPAYDQSTIPVPPQAQYPQQVQQPGYYAPAPVVQGQPQMQYAPAPQLVPMPTGQSANGSPAHEMYSAGNPHQGMH